jgi:hypothetical protein
MHALGHDELQRPALRCEGVFHKINKLGIACHGTRSHHNAWQLSVNRLVVGSNPTRGAIFILCWGVRLVGAIPTIQVGRATFFRVDLPYFRTANHLAFGL